MLSARLDTHTDQQTTFQARRRKGQRERLREDNMAARHCSTDRQDKYSSNSFESWAPVHLCVFVVFHSYFACYSCCLYFSTRKPNKMPDFLHASHLTSFLCCRVNTVVRVIKAAFHSAASATNQVQRNQPCGDDVPPRVKPLSSQHGRAKSALWYGWFE